MKKLIVLVAMAIVGMLSGCGNPKKADIVTTMFPQYDFARQIVKDKMTVSLLIAPGAEAHDFEPTSQDFEAIFQSKLFLFTSLELDTWLGSNPAQFVGPNTKWLNLSEEFTPADHVHHHNHDVDDDHNHNDDDDHDDDDHDDDHDHDHSSLHYWTDPTTAMQLIDAILNAIIEIDPENAVFYQDNALAYKERIHDLHDEIDHFLMDPLYKNSTIYFAGHNAMDAFAERYHLNIIALSNTYQPDADLTSRQIEALLVEVKNANTHYIFTEELVEPKIAKTIQRELARENYVIFILELHGYHNVTRKQIRDGISYADLLEQNFLNIKTALENPEGNQ